MSGIATALLIGATCIATPLQKTQESGLTTAGFVVASPSDDLKELYESGIPFSEFLEYAERRKERWDDNYWTAKIDAALLARVLAVGGTWKILVIAVDGCSDSVSTIPYLARMAEEFDDIDLRIVNPTAGKEVMRRHPTPDGREATPTVVLLNDQYEEVGCFIERPEILRKWEIRNRGVLSEKDYLSQKFDWYDKDGGRSTVTEMVELIEAAAAGSVGC